MLGYRDLSISYIPLVSESVPHAWYHKKSKISYFFILYIWLLLGFLLAQAYKSNLLANLVKVDYEKPPATFQVEIAVKIK